MIAKADSAEVKGTVTKPVVAAPVINTCNMPGTTAVALSLLAAPDGARILDLGCYRGDVSRELLQRGYRVSSCDLVGYPGTEQLPDFHQVDANARLPFEDGCFQAIISTEVIEHLENPTNLLRECSRLLTDGGTLVLSTPNIGNVISRLVYAATGEFPQFRGMHFREWNHISPVSPAWIRNTADRLGMDVQSVTSEGSSLTLRRRLIFWLTLPFFAIAARHQPGALTADHTLILVLRKRVARP